MEETSAVLDFARYVYFHSPVLGFGYTSVNGIQIVNMAYLDFHKVIIKELYLFRRTYFGKQDTVQYCFNSSFELKIRINNFLGFRLGG